MKIEKLGKLRKSRQSKDRVTPRTVAYFAGGALSLLVLRGIWKKKVGDGEARFHLPSFLKSPTFFRFIPGVNGAERREESAARA